MLIGLVEGRVADAEAAVQRRGEATTHPRQLALDHLVHVLGLEEQASLVGALLGHGAEYPLRAGRAADVARANEQNAKGFRVGHAPSYPL